MHFSDTHLSKSIKTNAGEGGVIALREERVLRNPPFL
jgi:hypothetical protein